MFIYEEDTMKKTNCLIGILDFYEQRKYSGISYIERERRKTFILSFWRKRYKRLLGRLHGHKTTFDTGKSQIEDNVYFGAKGRLGWDCPAAKKTSRQKIYIFRYLDVNETPLQEVICKR